MHVHAKLLLEFSKLGSHALADRRASHGESPQPVLPTDMLEAQEIERLRFTFPHHSGLQPFSNEPQDARICDAMLHELDQPALVEVIEKASDVRVQNVVHLLLQKRIRQRIQRIVLAAPRANPIREAEKVLLI